ncbi:MAG TPA: trehalose-phosphatase [Alphaproteobacteria bacterium]|nr:trehalose-phosphatase [Alphaproteobacteria bacterium]
MPFKLSLKRDALFLDIDGTLLDIAPTPEEVFVSSTLIDSLWSLHQKLDGALALVSGRTIKNIDQLFSPLRLPAIGVHGLEWREDTHSAVMHSGALDEEIRRRVSHALEKLPGVLIENKTYSLAIHYRQAPQHKDRIYDLVNSAAPMPRADVELLEGKMVYELIRKGHGKKPAIERFMQLPDFSGRRPIFFGDDETDKPAIAAFSKLYGTGVLVGEDTAFNLGLFYHPKAVRGWLIKQAE